MLFLMVHFTVERWREALLWSWVVGKHGNLDDSWGEGQTSSAWEELKSGSTDEEAGRKLFVRGGNRSTLETERVDDHLKRAGVGSKDPTKYEFCESLVPFLSFNLRCERSLNDVVASHDGYPYTGFINGKNWWPKLGFGVPKHEAHQCTLDPVQCFTDPTGQPFTHASDIFMHVAFREFKCGDCSECILDLQ